MTDNLQADGAILLAGGKSQRMGEDKTRLLVDGQSILVRTITKLQGFADRIIIVADDISRISNPVGVTPEPEIVIDRFPDTGPLGGIITGMQALGDGSHLVVACDMPGLNIGVLELLLQRVSANFDAVVPTTGGNAEPLCAVYNSTCLPLLLDYLASGGRSVHKALSKLNTVYIDESTWGPVDPTGNCFTNLNKPEDLAQYLARISPSSSN
ncbi:MAG: molybdenum cofactor guanylyltransferase [Chthonomonadales bacterium]